MFEKDWTDLEAHQLESSHKSMSFSCLFIELCFISNLGMDSPIDSTTKFSVG